MRTTVSFTLWAVLLGGCGDDDGTIQDGGLRTDAMTVGGGVTDAAAADAALEDGAAAADSAPLDGGPPGRSTGCGMAAMHNTGGVQTTTDFGEAAGGERGFFLVLPSDYDPDAPARLIVAYAGTNWLGEMIRPYFRLEDEANDGMQEIFVYPDLRFRNFPGWGELGGWLLGPHAAPADGMEDIAFIRALVAYLQDHYCIDPGRIFATGHSWGGDMAAVSACFLGDVFTATAPAAANRPYWFEPRSGEVGCVGEAAVWTFYGQNDTHFGPGGVGFGDEQIAFWRGKHRCPETASQTLDYGVEDECVAFEGCSIETRYCFYERDAGHQIPSYFTPAIMTWFRSF